jgi:hypothetical protein
MVTPERPATTDPLKAEYDWYDADVGSGGELNQSQPGAPYIVWYRDGEPMEAYADLLTVPASATNRGELWHFIIIPTDGMGLNGTAVESTNVTVGNSLPELDNAELSPDVLYTDTDVTVGPIGWYDADGDDAGYIYAWQLNINGVWETVEGETTSRLSSEHFQRDYSVRAVVTPYDGYEAGEPVYSNSSLVLNSPPTIEEVSIGILGNRGSGVGEATVHDILIAEVIGYHDADGDPAALYHFQWYKQDGPIPGAVSPSLELRTFSVGDSFTVDVIPDDGFDLGETVTSNEVTIINRPPSLESVTLQPSEPREFDDIIALPQGYSDPEGDPAGQPRFTWYIDSMPLANYTGSLLLSSYTSVGQTVFVVVEPYDGTSFGAGVTSPTISVGAALPDTDGDGIPDIDDADMDGDGVLNDQDQFPYDENEFADLDMDGIGDNADDDTDGDGVLDERDDFPYNPDESVDTDGDGIGDNTDNDIDGDGILNEDDADPYSSEATLEDQFDLMWLELLLLVIVFLLALLLLRSYMKKKKDDGQMANCSECGAVIPMAATVCDTCGAEFEEEGEEDMGPEDEMMDDEGGGGFDEGEVDEE